MSRVWVIYLLAIISFLVGTSEYVIAGILDKIADTTHISIASAGQLITVFSISFGLGTPILIALTSQLDRKKLLMYALIVFSIFSGMIALFSGFETLVLARIITGLSTGVIEVATLSLAASLATPDKQGSAIGTVIMGLSASLIIGVPIGRVVASVYDWELIFIGLCALGLLFSILTACFVPKMNGEKSIPLLEQLQFFKDRRVAVTLTVSFIWPITYSIMYTYISPYLLEVIGISEQWVIIVLFVFGIAGIIGSKLGGYGTDHWGESRTLLAGMALNMISLILLALSDPFSMIFIIPIILWGLASWTPGPPIQYRLITLAPGAASILLGLYNSVLQLGMASGAGIGGFVIKQGSLHNITWVSAAGMTIVIIILFADYLQSKRSGIVCPQNEQDKQNERTHSGRLQ
jgi:MFS transporter, DHA1 family, putative efflux transporter